MQQLPIIPKQEMNIKINKNVVQALSKLWAATVSTNVFSCKTQNIFLPIFYPKQSCSDFPFITNVLSSVAASFLGERDMNIILCPRVGCISINCKGKGGKGVGMIGRMCHDPVDLGQIRWQRRKSLSPVATNVCMFVCCFTPTPRDASSTRHF